MITKSKQLLLIAVVTLVVISPLVVSAQTGRDTRFPNPLQGLSDITTVLINIIKWLFGAAIVLAMAAIVYAAIRLIVGFGTETEAQQAKNIIKWAILGLIVVFIAFVIVDTLQDVLKAG